MGILKSIRIFLTLLLVFTVISCETELDISKVVQKKRIVINAILNDQDAVKIYISNSTSISDSVKPAALKSASVKITDPAGIEYICTFNLVTESYDNSLVMQAGKKYTIEVKAKEYPDASATIEIPFPSSNQKSQWKDSTSLDSFGFPLGMLTVFINDNGGQKNYYRTTLFYYDDLLAKWSVLLPNTTDAEINNQAIKTEDGGLIFSDASFNGKNRSIAFITPFGFAGQTPKFLVVIENLSSDYYLYYKSIDDYRTGGGFFSEPSAIYTNIKNGLGVAAGSSIKRDTIH